MKSSGIGWGDALEHVPGNEHLYPAKGELPK